MIRLMASLPRPRHTPGEAVDFALSHFTRQSATHGSTTAKSRQVRSRENPGYAPQGQSPISFHGIGRILVRIRHCWIGLAASVIASAAIVLPSGAQQTQQGSSKLSFTAAQVASGMAEYRASCNDCHGPHLDDGEFGGPPLIGAAFTGKWFKLPPGALVNYIHNAMPPDAPGRLPLGTYVEITAYILARNGLPPKPDAMPASLKTLMAMHYPAISNGPPQKSEKQTTAP